jgi:uncharacterized protein YqeY
MEAMTLKDKLNQALKEAMKAGDSRKKATLRLALAEVKNAEIEEQGELDEGRVLSILQKEVKARQETIEGAQQADRQDLIDKAKAEIEILNEFLPQPLSEEELREIVLETISELGAESMADMGQVMGALMPKIRGKADGKTANQLVREALGS